MDHHHAGIHNAFHAVANRWHVHVHQVLRIALRQLVAHPRVQPEPLLGKGLHQRAALQEVGLREGFQVTYKGDIGDINHQRKGQQQRNVLGQPGRGLDGVESGDDLFDQQGGGGRCHGGDDHIDQGPPQVGPGRPHDASDERPGPVGRVQLQQRTAVGLLHGF